MLTQSPTSLHRAAQTISPDDIRRRINIIADDSMKGRDTPSPELDKTAAYIAGEYRRVSPKPAGGGGTVILRDSTDPGQGFAQSSVAFGHGTGGGGVLARGVAVPFSRITFPRGEFSRPPG